MRHLLLLFFLLGAFESVGQPEPRSFLVCGDHLIHVVDYQQSRDSVPTIVWTWDSRKASDLSGEVKRRFRSMDDCKPALDGKVILASSSSGAIAVIDYASKAVLFHAEVPNAHSIELLPGQLLAAAASTAPNGNKLMVFDWKSQNPDPVFTDSLYSAHGLGWDARRKRLFALGYDVLREYKMPSPGRFTLAREWKIPGVSGHDLQPSRDGKRLYITEREGAWIFDLRKQTFTKIPGFPDAPHIKSLGENRAGQFIFTPADESWWTYHVRFFNPGRSFAFPGMTVYKARWVE